MLTEALSSPPATQSDGNGAGLSPGVDEQLRRNVKDALDHAGE